MTASTPAYSARWCAFLFLSDDEVYGIVEQLNPDTHLGITGEANAIVEHFPVRRWVYRCVRLLFGTTARRDFVHVRRHLDRLLRPESPGKDGSPTVSAADRPLSAAVLGVAAWI